MFARNNLYSQFYKLHISCYRLLILEIYCRGYYTQSSVPTGLNFPFLVHLNLRGVETKLLRITANITTPLPVLFFAPSLSLSAIFSCSSLPSSKYQIPADALCKSHEITGNQNYACVYVCVFSSYFFFL